MPSHSHGAPAVRGYRRNRHRFGIRNHVVVVPTVFCTNSLACKIASHFTESRFGESGENRVIAISHGVGCCSVGFDEELAMRSINNACLNPNVGAVLSVSLGCGQFCTACGQGGSYAADGPLARVLSGMPLQGQVVVQAPGGSEEAFAKAVSQIERFISRLEAQPREELSLAELFVGVMNGSSDPTSGLFSNIAVGCFNDWLLEQGGRVAFSQTLETLGAEQQLMGRVARPEVDGKVDDRLGKRMGRLLQAITTMRQAVEADGGESEPTPGNRRRGISSLAEKSIGTLFKIGQDAQHRIVDVVPHGEVAGKRAGIYLVDGPGQDIICLSGLVSAGAQLVLFTTGGGTPTGSAISPTIKVTANRETFERMECDIDICLPVEELFDEAKPGAKRSLRQIALDELVPLVVDVSNGKRLTSAERRSQGDYQVRQLWPID